MTQFLNLTYSQLLEVDFENLSPDEFKEFRLALKSFRPAKPRSRRVRTPLPKCPTESRGAQAR